MTGSENTRNWQAVRLDELDSIPVAEGLIWHPIRRRLGIEAFGINAYTAETVGSQVVEEHDELAWDGSGGHEEVYLVVNGHATFTLDGEELEAPAGTLLFIREPRLRRVAVSKSPGTLVLAVGAPRGEAYTPRAWEGRFVAAPAHRAGRYAEAIAILTAELDRHPENPALLYDLACAEALGNRPLDALTHLTEAIRRAPRYAEHARTDPDFDGLRREPGFPA